MNLTQHWRRILRDMRPGQCLEISMRELYDVPAPPGWNPAEWLLEGIVGSAYEYKLEEMPWSQRVRYTRLEKPLDGDLMAYVSPDRRDYYERTMDGFWRWKGPEQ